GGAAAAGGGAAPGGGGGGGGRDGGGGVRAGAQAGPQGREGGAEAGEQVAAMELGRHGCLLNGLGRHGRHAAGGLLCRRSGPGAMMQSPWERQKGRLPHKIRRSVLTSSSLSPVLDLFLSVYLGSCGCARLVRDDYPVGRQGDRLRLAADDGNGVSAACKTLEVAELLQDPQRRDEPGGSVFKIAKTRHEL